jgi:hypothetical protein
MLSISLTSASIGSTIRLSVSCGAAPGYVTVMKTQLKLTSGINLRI